MRPVAIALTAAAIGCAQPKSAALSPVPTVQIVGSESMNALLIPLLVDTYTTTHDVDFKLAGGGSSAGFKALNDGTAVLASSSREPTAAEQEQAAVDGITFQRHLVGVNVISVTSHASNPLSSLTYGQVSGAFCAGELTNWSQLGLQDTPITVVVRDDKSGSREVFEDFFCGPEGLYPMHKIGDSQTIRDILANDRGALAFTPLSDPAGKPLALRAYDGASSVVPSQANAIRGNYPLTHDLAFYTAGEPTGEVKVFLNWLASPAGQHTVDQAHVVPLFLRPERNVDARPLRETVHFEDDGNLPNQRSVARLQVLERELRDRGGEINHVILEGYADPTEPNAMSRSQARAEAVRQRLIKRIPSLFFEIIPRGAANPIAPNDTPKGRSLNRRVQIYLAEEERLAEQEADEELNEDELSR